MRCKLSLLFSILLVIPLISAFNGYSNPLDYIDNEWTKFAIIFILLFAAIYTFVNNRMQNTPVAAVVGAGLSLLISIPIMKRDLLEPFLNEGIIDWVVIIALLIGLLFIFYWMSFRREGPGIRRFSWPRFIVFLLFLAILSVYIRDLIPEQLMIGPVESFIEFIEGIGFWIWVVFAGFIIWLIWTFIRRFRGGGGKNRAPRNWSVGGFSFRKGMRRGGKNNPKVKRNPGSFVSKKAVERYARVYGEDAARRRFG